MSEPGPEPRLGRLQSWMQAVVTHPGGVASGVESSEARRHIEVGPGTVEDVVTPSATLSGTERLAIYGRAYHARLLECLRSTFPALRHALGDELFDEFGRGYLHRHPPVSYTLNRLADRFPEYLEETRPDADAAPEEKAVWPSFLVDLATLERAVLEIYDGPGTEGQGAPDRRQVLEIPPDLFLACRPVVAPCLRVFVFDFPVHDYLLAVRRGEEAELPSPSPCHVAVSRKDYRVRLRELSELQFELLRTFDGRSTLAQALDRIAPVTSARESLRVSIAEVTEWIATWADEGFLDRLPSAEPRDRRAVTRLS